MAAALSKEGSNGIKREERVEVMLVMLGTEVWVSRVPKYVFTLCSVRSGAKRWRRAEVLEGRVFCWSWNGSLVNLGIHEKLEWEISALLTAGPRAGLIRDRDVGLYARWI